MADHIVRPLRFVEPEPVIRRIGDRDLFLGNVHAADPNRHDHDFVGVLSATTAPQPGTTHHHPLDDGPENEWGTFAAAVDATRRLRRGEGPVLVHCMAGVSRSTTLIATALAAAEDRTFRETLDIVQGVRPVATPHPALHEQAVYYLAARA